MSALPSTLVDSPILDLSEVEPTQLPQVGRHMRHRQERSPIPVGREGGLGQLCVVTYWLLLLSLLSEIKSPSGL